MPKKVHVPFSNEDDAFLWAHRNDDLGAVAQALGRGRKGVTARLKRLSDPATEGHARLFGERQPPKESSLRPVRDAVQRIMWDETLDRSTFFLGYRDRFRAAPIEVAFDAPNANVKGSATQLVLALPEHRIQYIKYKRRLVWHKALRLDLIFGSGKGHGMRIQHVVQTYPSWSAERSAWISSARKAAARALGSGEQLKALMQLVSKVRLLRASLSHPRSSGPPSSRDPHRPTPCPAPVHAHASFQ